MSLTITSDVFFWFASIATVCATILFVVLFVTIVDNLK